MSKRSFGSEANYVTINCSLFMV